MSSQQMQSNRFELKYVIDEYRARQVRKFVQSYLEPDDYAKPEHDYSYYIHSLYLDSPDKSLCNATIAGHRNRVKLRIRFYEDKPNTPIFFEIKRRVNEVILKERAAVRKSSVMKLLHGWMPEQSDLFKPGDIAAWTSLWRFMEMKDAIGAKGCLFVSYLREAWVHPKLNSLRITIDRDLTTQPYINKESWLDLSDYEKWRRPPLEGVVLEIKFTDKHPNWISDMVRALNLRRGSFAKYVTCHVNQGHASPTTPDGLTYFHKFMG
jgi:SPX domain protein involved in polyphosphate accumulation